LQEINEQEFINALKNDQINPYQIYNFDLEYSSFYSTNHYLNYKHDNITKEQDLNILFFDIECFTNNAGEFPAPEAAKYPIVSNTIYSTFEKTYESFFMLISENTNLFPKDKISELEKKFKDYLIENKYLDDDENIKIHIFTNEIELITESWKRIHEIDPLILSGFNADFFDLPYIYNRLMNLFNENKDRVNSILSKFGQVTYRSYHGRPLIQICEYPLADIRHLYVPRAEGGMNYGKTQPKYSLDWISSQELNLKKLEYKDTGISIDNFYLKDPENYLLYNIIDVVLVNKLNQKLQHIQLHNMLRRIMYTPFSASLRGSSVLFDNFVFHELRSQNKNVRFGIIDEKKVSISKEEIQKLPLPKIQLNKNYNIKEIDANTFTKFTSRFVGAYVKEAPLRSVYDIRDGIIADLDATALYPSMIRQHNISFNSFKGKIIDPICYDFIDLLNKHVNKSLPFPSLMYNQLAKICKLYVKKKQFQNMGDAVQIIYYIIVYLTLKLKDCGSNLAKIFRNEDIRDYVFLKNYFIPLTNMITDVKGLKEYNSFTYNYLLNGEFNSDYIYIIENINEPTIQVRKILSSDFEKYLKSNDLSVTLSGALFSKHEKEIGLFSEFLKNMKARRDNYKKKRNEHPVGSEEYNKYDRMQLAVKIVSNTTYGLFGLSSYRYSNSELAKAITVQGRLTLKISQIVAEKLLSQLEGE